MSDWRNEIDLSADARPVAMGTRRLGDRPWLIPPTESIDLLALKAELLARRPDEVWADSSGGSAGSMATAALALVADAIGPGSVVPDDEPLVSAARSVAEDLCLLRRDGGRWTLSTAVVCFPSRWRLADKIGHPINTVHAPVRSYDTVLADRMVRFFDALDDRPVMRRNWFVHPDGAWSQPERPLGGDPVMSGPGLLDELFVRSERQTLRRLDDEWILFTIRVQQCSVAQFVVDPERRRSFWQWLTDVSPEVRRHRGLSDGQLPLLLDAI